MRSASCTAGNSEALVATSPFEVLHAHPTCLAFARAEGSFTPDSGVGFQRPMRTVSVYAVARVGDSCIPDNKVNRITETDAFQSSVF